MSVIPDVQRPRDAPDNSSCNSGYGTEVLVDLFVISHPGAWSHSQLAAGRPLATREGQQDTLSWPSVTPRGHGAWVAAASSEELSRTPRGAML